jgi:hypothetical protein
LEQDRQQQDSRYQAIHLCHWLIMAHIKDSKLKFETSEEVKVAPTFDAMGLKEDLLRGIYAYSEQMLQM